MKNKVKLLEILGIVGITLFAISAITDFYLGDYWSIVWKLMIVFLMVMSMWSSRIAESMMDLIQRQQKLMEEQRGVMNKQQELLDKKIENIK